MKSNYLFMACVAAGCLFIAGCRSKDPVNIQQQVPEQAGVEDAVTAEPGRDGERVVVYFEDSLCGEGKLETFKNLALFLWDKECFIEENFDSVENNFKAYRGNYIRALDTFFVNNELLGDCVIRIGMFKEEVLELLGVPHRSIIEGNAEAISYFQEMEIAATGNPEGGFLGACTIEFFFDDGIVTKIDLCVEDCGPITPKDDYYW